MRRAPAFVLLLGCAVGVCATDAAATAQAGDKVHTLSAGSLKIDGKIDRDDDKVRVTNPANNGSASLPAKTYMVKLAAGRYQLDLTSDDIDCVLAVQDKTGKQVAFDDDSGKGNTGLNSRLVFQANDDTYKVVATSFDSSPGPFTLTIKQLGGAGAGGAGAGGGGDDDAKPIAGDVDQSAPKVRIELPNGKNVSLPAKMHEVKLEAGKYQFDAVAKEDLDPVVIVQDSTGKQLGFNDDVEPGNLNSRLMLDIAKPGAHKVYVAALQHPNGDHGAGAYTLTVKRLGAGGGGGQPAGKALSLKDGNLTVKGSVERDDPRVSNQIPFPAKVHEVNLPAGRYQFDLMSTEIDPVLVIADNTGRQLAIDDDGGEGLNSRLSFQAPKAGVYKIYAASLGGRAGAYTLTIKSQGGAGAGKDQGKVLDVGVRGVRVNGALSRETKSINYRVKLEQGKSYVIEMQSANQDELDPFIEVHDAGGKKLAQDDDGAGDLNSRLVFRAPESGVYTIVARSFANSGVGDFTILVKEQE